MNTSAMRTFELAFSDIIAFNLHHAKHHEQDKYYNFKRFGFGLLYLVLGAAFIHLLSHYLFGGLFLLIGSLWIGCFAFLKEEWVRRRVSRQYRKLKANYPKSFNLSLTTQGLTVSHEGRDNQFLWNELERIDSTLGYHFFYFTQQDAFIVRHEVIEPEELAHFLRDSPLKPKHYS